jgi:cytochrome P450
VNEDLMTELLDVPDFPLPRDARCPFDPPPYADAAMRAGRIERVRIWDGTTPWMITRYDDVRAILSDSRTSADIQRPGFPDWSPSAAATAVQRRSFLNLDDPEHAQQRRLLTVDFMIKRVEAMRPKVQRIVDDLIDDMLAGPKPANLVAALALPMPSLVICELLGVPFADQEMFQHLGEITIAQDATPEEAVDAHESLLEYLIDLTLKKAADPGDDLLSRLAVQQLATGGMTAEQIGKVGKLLLVAGHETTANMIALGTVALLQNPEQLDEIRKTDDPQLIAATVEELLRYLTVVHFGRRRIALEDIELGGITIRAGDGIVIMIENANRDESAFPHADQLDIHRDARHHVGFGFGVHQCLGQPLARVELQVVYNTLYRRIPTLQLAVPLEELPFKHDINVYGVHNLPVTW